MNIRTGMAALFTTALALASNSAFGQVSVSEAGQRTVYVDSTRGIDANVGTLAAPIHSLQAALNQAAQNDLVGIGTKVVVAPGVYREALTLGPSHSNATLTLQASVTGASVLSGSDVVTGWAHSSGAVYVHSYSSPSGTCPYLAKLPAGSTPIAFKRDMIFVNGGLLTQVLSRSAMHAGTFFVNTSTHLAYIWLKNSANPSGYRVEVAHRPHTLVIAGRSNVVLRGLTFQHAASCINDDSAKVMSGSNILVDGIKAQWNNFGGFHLSATRYATVQNSVAAHNGGVGFSGYKNKYLTFSFDESDYNNWRGAWGHFYDYGMGGFEFMLTHTGTFNKLYAYHNLAQGLWFDTDNKNITVSNASIVGNYYQNVQIELNQGPITIKNSLVCSGTNGMIVLETHGLTVTGTKFYNNGGVKNTAQIFLGGKPGGRAMRDWETGQYYNLFTKYTTFSGNQLADATSAQYVFSTYLSGYDWSQFAYSLHSNSNQWYDRTKSTAFTLPASRHVNLTGWRNNTGQDRASSWYLSPTLVSTCGAQAAGVVK